MSQTLHIVRKDVRRLRWWLTAWVLLLAARVLLATTGWEIGNSIEGQIVVEQANAGIRLVTALLFALLVSQLVHDEPTVGLDGFWLTRPYDRWALLHAKLAFAIGFCIVLPLFSELAVMAAFDAGPADMLRASSVFLARDVLWTLGLMVVAVLTLTLLAFTLWIVGSAAVLSLLMFGVLAVTMLTFEEETSPAVMAAVDPTSRVVATILSVMGALVVIGYQYHRRRPGRAILLLLFSLAIVILVPARWPWSLARVERFDPPAWAADPVRVVVSVDRSTPPEISDEPVFRGRSRRTRQVHVQFL